MRVNYHNGRGKSILLGHARFPFYCTGRKPGVKAYNMSIRVLRKSKQNKPYGYKLFVI